MGTRSFLGEKRPGRGVDTHHHLAPRLKKKYSYTSTPLWTFVACYRVNFTVTFTFIVSFLGTHRMEKKQEKRKIKAFTERT
jgi:hypothetical protein